VFPTGKNYTLSEDWRGGERCELTSADASCALPGKREVARRRLCIDRRHNLEKSTQGASFLAGTPQVCDKKDLLGGCNGRKKNGGDLWALYGLQSICQREDRADGPRLRERDEACKGERKGSTGRCRDWTLNATSARNLHVKENAAVLRR